MAKSTEQTADEAEIRGLSDNRVKPVLATDINQRVSKYAARFVMAILSLVIFEHCIGVAVQHIQSADLNLVGIWDAAEGKLIHVKHRAMKYYENIRLVYQIERRLKDLQKQQGSGMFPPENPRERALGEIAAERAREAVMCVPGSK